MTDNVNHPAHYTGLPGLEVIDIIRAALGPEGFKAYCIGNSIKYRMRAGKKGDAAECLAKAETYERWANEAAAKQPGQTTKWPADDSRIDAIGQNGPTGEHYNAAKLARQADTDWIEWGGGECPVRGHTRVEVETGGGWRKSKIASAFEWTISGNPFDIIAYRVL